MNNNIIPCEVLTFVKGEAVHIGYIYVYSVPRAGEYIQFSEKRCGYTHWIVDTIHHQVGSGLSIDYTEVIQTVNIYVKRSIDENSRNWAHV